MRTMLRGKFTLLFLMLGLLAIPGIALADIVIVNDVRVGRGNATNAGARPAQPTSGGPSEQYPPRRFQRL